VPKLRVPVTPADHGEGPADAPLVLVEYGDYECPHCGRAYPIVKDIQKALKKDLRFVFRNFPLAEMHPHALAAARAAEAASLQDKFWQMHDQLFEHQQHLDDRSILRYGEAIGLDLARFTADARGAAITTHVESDIEGGARSGVNGTPTFFINGVRHDGSFDYETLVAAVRAALQRP
jgi:protein-disulfide isomerase